MLNVIKRHVVAIGLSAIALLNGCQHLQLAGFSKPEDRSQAKTLDLQQPAPGWDWASLVPVGLPSADMADAIVHPMVLHEVAPDTIGDPALANRMWRISHVDGAPIGHYGNLLETLDSLKESEESVVQVDWKADGMEGPKAVQAAMLTLDNLDYVAGSIHPQQPVMQYSECGSPWVMIREGGVRCSLQARYEKQSGLVHATVTLLNGSDRSLVLPRDVQASVERQPLACMSVNDVLARLYGEEAQPASFEPSLARASATQAYRLATSYKALAKRMDERSEEDAVPTEPAMLSDQTQPYPGAPWLADARALSGLVMQCESMAPRTPERVGWVVFDGRPVSQGQHLQLSVDLGRGPRTVTFLVP